jgi:hypothetical protein
LARAQARFVARQGCMTNGTAGFLPRFPRECQPPRGVYEESRERCE